MDSSEANSKWGTGRSSAAIVAFLFALWIPPLASVFEQDEAISFRENRFLTEFPSLEANGSSWQSFPARMERYYDDRFGFRDELISRYALLKIELFGVSPTDTLVIGKEGWFFFGDADDIAHYRGVGALTVEELETWRAVVEERRDWLAQQGIAYLMVLVPGKHVMYSEFMPDNLPRTGGPSPLDQLAEHLMRHSDVDVLDLRPALLAAKSRERIYHRTDSHWNDVGAYAGYSSILDQLREIVPSLSAARPVPTEKGVEMTPGLGLASIVGLKSRYREENISMPPAAPRAKIKPESRQGYEERVQRLAPIAHGVDDHSLPRAVMFRDSFGNALIPYLSEHFSRILYVWDRDVDPRVVAVEKPDVVIQQIVGRFMGRRPIGIRERQAMKVRAGGQ